MHPKKALLPMLRRDFGNEIEVNNVFSKARGPIFRVLVGMLQLANAMAFSKIDSGI